MCILSLATCVPSAIWIASYCPRLNMLHDTDGADWVENGRIDTERKKWVRSTNVLHTHEVVVVDFNWQKGTVNCSAADVYIYKYILAWGSNETVFTLTQNKHTKNLAYSPSYLSDKNVWIQLSKTWLMIVPSYNNCWVP